MSLSTRVKSFIGLAGALAGIATLLITLALALPSQYSVPAGGVRSDANGFAIEWIVTSGGAQVVSESGGAAVGTWKQGLFSGSSILSGSGRYAEGSVEHIWVLLRDRYGRYYLQYPPAELSGPRWDMANIRVGREIAAIEFWGVDGTGNSILQRLADGMISSGNWPGLSKRDLPDRYSDLGSIALLYRRGFPYVF